MSGEEFDFITEKPEYYESTNEDEDAPVALSTPIKKNRVVPTKTTKNKRKRTTSEEPKHRVKKSTLWLNVFTEASLKISTAVDTGHILPKNMFDIIKRSGGELATTDNELLFDVMSVIYCTLPTEHFRNRGKELLKDITPIDKWSANDYKEMRNPILNETFRMIYTRFSKQFDLFHSSKQNPNNDLMEIFST